MDSAKNVLWFSRHTLTNDQFADLQRIFGDINVQQINKTITSARDIEDDIAKADIIAIVAPIGLQADVLKLAGDKPVISCRSKRVFDTNDNTKVQFVFDGWFQILKIDVVTKDL